MAGHRALQSHGPYRASRSSRRPARRGRYIQPLLQRGRCEDGAQPDPDLLDTAGLARRRDKLRIHFKVWEWVLLCCVFRSFFFKFHIQVTFFNSWFYKI